ncbi:MAG: NeuD/PglB/VioB family sugar acetyltransferase [Bryobacteraceae bacterium]|nr:NeuD/PglB/VioB family sugar acetyltransferase [Bryobacteraceae bacterium]
MPQPRLLIIGSGGHARSVLEVARAASVGEILGLLDRFREAGSERLGYRVLGGEADAARLAAECGVWGVAFGIGDNWGRAGSLRLLREAWPEAALPVLVHPFSSVAEDAEMGEGTVVMPGAVVRSGARIGRCALLNTGCSVDHDSVMGDFASLAPGARVGGGVRIGSYSAIGLGASVIHNVSIGEHVVVGAGAVVLKDLPDAVVAYGTPARVVRQRQAGEAYL